MERMERNVNYISTEEVALENDNIKVNSEAVPAEETVCAGIKIIVED